MRRPKHGSRSNADQAGCDARGSGAGDLRGHEAAGPEPAQAAGVSPADGRLVSWIIPLENVIIRVGDFASVVQPGRDDLVYCDPPYDGVFTGYQASGFAPRLFGVKP